MKSKYYIYYVEGQCEEKLINTLKCDSKLIRPGKVQICNVIGKKITQGQLMMIKPHTVVVLVFDTDVMQTTILYENIKILEKCSNVDAVITITQVRNFEEELLYSCDIKNILEFTHSKSNADFKRDFIHISNLQRRLEEVSFDISKFWSRSPVGSFAKLENGAEQIKL